MQKCYPKFERNHIGLTALPLVLEAVCPGAQPPTLHALLQFCDIHCEFFVHSPTDDQKLHSSFVSVQPPVDPVLPVELLPQFEPEFPQFEPELPQFEPEFPQFEPELPEVPELPQFEPVLLEVPELPQFDPVLLEVPELPQFDPVFDDDPVLLLHAIWQLLVIHCAFFVHSPTDAQKLHNSCESPDLPEPLTVEPDAIVVDEDAPAAVDAVDADVTAAAGVAVVAAAAVDALVTPAGVVLDDAPATVDDVPVDDEPQPLFAVFVIHDPVFDPAIATVHPHVPHDLPQLTFM
jgi:hypothetical protein